MSKSIEIAPHHAVFDVRGNVRDDLRHRIDLDVKKEAMTVSDKKGDEIVVMAADVRNLVEALQSAETLVSIDIENCMKKTGGTNAD